MNFFLFAFCVMFCAGVVAAPLKDGPPVNPPLDRVRASHNSPANVAGKYNKSSEWLGRRRAGSIDSSSSAARGGSSCVSPKSE